MSQAASKAFDLTHAYGPDFPTFVGPSQFSKEARFAFAKDGFNQFEQTVNEHAGTHVDAPFYLSADGISVDQIEVGDPIVPLCVVDIREKSASDPDAQVTPDDLSDWMAANGAIPVRACVSMLSGRAEKLDAPEFRGADAEGKLHFPGFHFGAKRCCWRRERALARSTRCR